VAEPSHLCDSTGRLYDTSIALHIYDEHMQVEVPCGVEHTEAKTKSKEIAITVPQTERKPSSILQ
jgi:hypothetical protein